MYLDQRIRGKNNRRVPHKFHKNQLEFNKTLCYVQIAITDIYRPLRLNIIQKSITSTFYADRFHFYPNDYARTSKNYKCVHSSIEWSILWTTSFNIPTIFNTVHTGLIAKSVAVSKFVIFKTLAIFDIRYVTRLLYPVIQNNSHLRPVVPVWRHT